MVRKAFVKIFAQPNLWNNDKMNNPFKKVKEGNEFEELGIAFKR